jgi:hypothetical protein
MVRRRSFVILAWLLVAGCSGQDAATQSEAARDGGAANGSAGHPGAGGGEAEEARAGAPGGSTGRGLVGEAGRGDNGGAIDGGSTAEPPSFVDPPPVSVDRAGLIETSGKHIVYSSYVPPEQYARNLHALDLESGDVHDLNPDRNDIIYTESSPDGHVFTFGSSNAARDDHLWLVRMLDDGLVPARLVAGFEDRPGNHYLSGYLGDGRFAVYDRGSNLIPNGVDVVDTWSNTLHWSIDTELGEAISHSTVAPSGLWLHYSLGVAALRDGFARITADGATTFELPIGTGLVYFGGDGNRAVYTVFDTPTGAIRLFVHDLPGEASEIDAVVVGATFSWLEGLTPDAQHALVYYESSAGLMQLRRIALDGSSDPVLLSDPARSLTRRVAARDGSATVLIYEDASGQALEIMIGDDHATVIAIAALPPHDQVPAGAAPAGDAGFWYWLGSTELHAIALEGGELVAAQINAAGEQLAPCGNSYPGTVPAPVHRHVFSDGAAGTLVLLDSSALLPARMATLMPAHGGQLGCPTWSPAGDSFGFVEHTDSTSYVYLVSWNDEGPSAPMLIHELEGVAELAIVRP